MTERRVIVDHVLFVVEDLDASRRLYTAALAPLGFVELHVQAVVRGTNGLLRTRHPQQRRAGGSAAGRGAGSRRRGTSGGRRRGTGVTPVRVTDGLDDVRGDPEGDETLLTAANLAREVAELHLTLASAWIGTRKWLLRQLRETNPAFADRFVSAIRAHAGGDVTPLMALAEDVLEASGGRLFDGYRASGKAVLEKFENDAGRRSSS
jgi:catechol 2,3-dioxygenase-like lactoylglutathione lyase family enzyme